MPRKRLQRLINEEPVRAAALWLALLALILRTFIPPGFMPAMDVEERGDAAGFTLVLCTGSGPLQGWAGRGGAQGAAKDSEPGPGVPASGHGVHKDELCPFAAAASPLSPGPALDMAFAQPLPAVSAGILPRPGLVRAPLLRAHRARAPPAAAPPLLT